MEATGIGVGTACLFNHHVKNQHANCLYRSQNQTKQTTSELGSTPPRQDLLHHALKLPVRASGNISIAANITIIQAPANEQHMEHVAGLTLLCRASHTLIVKKGWIR